MNNHCILSPANYISAEPVYETEQEAQKAFEDVLVELENMVDSDGLKLNYKYIINKIIAAHMKLIECAKGE